MAEGLSIKKAESYYSTFVSLAKLNNCVLNSCLLELNKEFCSSLESFWLRLNKTCLLSINKLISVDDIFLFQLIPQFKPFVAQTISRVLITCKKYNEACNWATRAIELKKVFTFFDTRAQAQKGKFKKLVAEIYSAEGKKNSPLSEIRKTLNHSCMTSSMS